jgi:hypothetical protein
LPEEFVCGESPHTQDVRGRYGSEGDYMHMRPFNPNKGPKDTDEKPEPFEPGQVTKIELGIPDIFHTFRRGHRVMVQVQSSWFPLVDRNPQRFVNIPTAKPEDFQKATHRIHRAAPAALSLTVQVLAAGGK